MMSIDETLMCSFKAQAKEGVRNVDSGTMHLFPASVHMSWYGHSLSHVSFEGDSNMVLFSCDLIGIGQ